MAIETIEVGGLEYRVENLDAMSQFHVVRRVAPVMAKVGLTMAEMRKSSTEESKEEFTFRIMEAGMEVVSKMSDADVDYVLFKCLSKAKRKQGDTDRFMQVATGNQLQFQDLNMQDMVRLSIEVMRVSGIFRFFQEQTGA